MNKYSFKNRRGDEMPKSSERCREIREEMKEKYKAIVVGVNSFGKGTVQEKVVLSTGASYKVTTKK